MAVGVLLLPALVLSSQSWLWDLTSASASRGARLTIYDISGRVVKTFDEGVAMPGRYKVTWNGTNDRGQRVASGVYFCAFEAAGERQTSRVVYLR